MDEQYKDPTGVGVALCHKSAMTAATAQYIEQYNNKTNSLVTSHGREEVFACEYELPKSAPFTGVNTLFTGVNTSCPRVHRSQE
jgi:hypothetical protein